jgi:hypothetical protein
MNIKNIVVKLNDLGGIVNFETSNGAFDSTFVLFSNRSITFGSGVDDARLNDAEIDAIVGAIEHALA